MHQMTEVSEKESLSKEQGVCGDISQLRDVDINIEQGQSNTVYSLYQNCKTLCIKNDSILAFRQNRTKEASSVRSSSLDPKISDDDAEKCKSAPSDLITVMTPSLLCEPDLSSESVDMKNIELAASSLIEFKTNCVRNENDSPILPLDGITPVDGLCSSCFPISLQMSVPKEIKRSCSLDSDAETSMNRENLDLKVTFSNDVDTTCLDPSLLAKLTSLFVRQECIFNSIATLELTLNRNKMEHIQFDQGGEECGGARSSLATSVSGSPSVGNDDVLYSCTRIYEKVNEDTPCFSDLTVPQVFEQRDMTTHSDSLASNISLEASTFGKTNDTGHGGDLQRFESDMRDSFEMTMPPAKAIFSESSFNYGSLRRSVQSDLAQVAPPVLLQRSILTDMQLSCSVFSYPGSCCSFWPNRPLSPSLEKIRRAHSAPPRISSPFGKESSNVLDDNDTFGVCSRGIKIPAIDCKRAWYKHLKSIFSYAPESSVAGLHETPSSGIIASEAQPYRLLFNDGMHNRTLSSASIVVSSPSCPPSTEPVSCVTSSIFSFSPSARDFLRSTSTIVSATVTPRSHSDSQSLRLPSLAHLSPRLSPGHPANEVEKQRGLHRLLPHTAHEMTSPSSPSSALVFKSITSEVGTLTSENTKNNDLISPMSAIVSMPSQSNDTCTHERSSYVLSSLTDPPFMTAPEFSHSTSPLPYIHAENFWRGSFCSSNCCENTGQYCAPCQEGEQQNSNDTSAQSLLSAGSVCTKAENTSGQHILSPHFSESTSTCPFKVGEGDIKGSANVSLASSTEEGALGYVNGNSRQDKPFQERAEAGPCAAALSSPKSWVSRAVPPVPVMRRPPMVPRVGQLPRSKYLAFSERARNGGGTVAAAVALDRPGVVEEDAGDTAYYARRPNKGAKLPDWNNYEVLHQLEHLPPAWRDLGSFPGVGCDVGPNTRPLTQSAPCSEAVATPAEVSPWSGGEGPDGDGTFTSVDPTEWGMSGQIDMPVMRARNSAPTRRRGSFHREQTSPERLSKCLSEEKSVLSSALVLPPPLSVPTLSLGARPLLAFQECSQNEAEGMPSLLFDGQEMPDRSESDFQPSHLHQGRGSAQSPDGVFVSQDAEEEMLRGARKDFTYQTALRDPVHKVRRGFIEIPNLNEIAARDGVDSVEDEISNVEWNAAERFAELERFQAYNQEAMLSARSAKYSPKSITKGSTTTSCVISSGDFIESDRGDTSSPEPQISVFEMKGPLRSTLRRRLREQHKLQ